MKDLESVLAAGLEGDVRLDAISRTLYATDASIYEIEPLGVVLPRTAQDVVHVVRVAADRGLALLPRGGGTSLAGQSVGRSLHMDFSRYMNRILEIDTGARWARVQPGVVLDELNDRLAPCGLQFGPDVSTSSRANLGGMIGNNSCGAHSLLYGKTIDHVLQLTVVLTDGTVAVLEPVDDSERQRRQERAGIEGRVYGEVRRIAVGYGDEVRARFPKVMRRVSGYNLDAFGGGAAFDLCKIVVGSEGTLCSVVEAKVGLVERPAHTAVVACHFADLVESMDGVLQALEIRPAAVELIDRLLIDQTEGQLQYSENRAFIEGDPEAILFVEVYGESSEELVTKAEDLETRLRGAGLGYAFVRAVTREAQRTMWDLRKAGLGLLMRMKGDAKPQPGIEDTCVPVEVLPEYVRRVKGLLSDHQLRAEFYGHASVGVLHIRPVIDLKRPQGVALLRHLQEELSDIVLEYGGSMSAEHGDGLARSEWIAKMFGPRIARAFEEVKDAFDPAAMMNPGKIVRPARMDESLRYGAGYGDAHPSTFFRYDEAGTFQQAVEMCSGVGHCRKKLVGTMCPSYMATLEEQHSTRGRANALRAALSGRLPGGLEGDDLYQAMDLCLECKACKAECPSSVDMAKLKYEFLAHYHGRHGYPLRSHLFARIDRLNRWMSPLAPLANAVLRSAPNRWLMERFVGIDRRRKMPALARQRFSTWFRRRPSTPGGGERGTVVFYNDTFTEYNEPQIGRAAVGLLEAAGYRVVLPAGERPCCGRPLISKGFLAEARERAGANLRALATYADRGWPVVGVEPSCVLTFRDDYLDLARDAALARRVAGNTYLLEEFLGARLRKGGPPLPFTGAARRILLHGHCHQKALAGSAAGGSATGGTAATVAILSAAPNFQVTEIASGCCGMAGSFGYEREHYDVSMQVGGPRLFEVIAGADEEVCIAAAGTSCRHQIADATGRRAHHWAELLAAALPRDGSDAGGQPQDR